MQFTNNIHENGTNERKNKIRVNSKYQEKDKIKTRRKSKKILKKKI